MAENRIELRLTGGFTVLQNSLIRDPRLSLTVKGLFSFMASLPPNWDFSVSGLAKVTGASRNSIQKYLAELENAGYLERHQNREGGKFSGCDYVIYDESDKPWSNDPDSPCTKICATVPCTNFWDTKNCAQINKDLKERKSNIPPNIPPDNTPRTAKWKPERFEGFWAYYPRQVKRDRAIRAWDKLKPSDSLIDSMGKALRIQVQFWSATQTDRQYIPHASTWLNGRRWEDDPAEYVITEPGETSGNAWEDDMEGL